MKGINADQLVAHRGYQKYYPENTLLSVRKALEAGALHVEVDVQLSHDQLPFVYHDDTLDRMSARTGYVHELDLSELTACPAHEPGRFGKQYAEEKIATLAELVAVIRAHPHATFYIELKEEAVKNHGADTCLEQIAQILQPVKAQCVLISFDLGALAKASQWNFNRIGPVLRDWTTRNQQIDMLGAFVMFINKNRIPATDKIVANCPVVVYEVDDKVEAHALLQRGAAKIETFAIGEMIR
jgi:glycerophosphoryl diester phosphodiesterase